jgi:hypothetical protein
MLRIALLLQQPDVNGEDETQPFERLPVTPPPPFDADDLPDTVPAIPSAAESFVLRKPASSDRG